MSNPKYKVNDTKRERNGTVEIKIIHVTPTNYIVRYLNSASVGKEACLSHVYVEFEYINDVEPRYEIGKCYKENAPLGYVRKITKIKDGKYESILKLQLVSGWSMITSEHTFREFEKAYPTQVADPDLVEVAKVSASIDRDFYRELIGNAMPSTPKKKYWLWDIKFKPEGQITKSNIYRDDGGFSTTGKKATGIISVRKHENEFIEV